jgi:hypothetical protein
LEARTASISLCFLQGLSIFLFFTPFDPVALARMYSQ